MAVQTNPSNRYLLGVYLLVVLILSYILLKGIMWMDGVR